MLDTTPRFLLVEDDEFFLPALCKMLENLDYTAVQICTTYQSANQAISKGDFDLALLDINLNSSAKNEEGIALGRLLQNQQTPFIYVTGLEEKSIVKRATQTRPAAYLFKPLTEIQLFSAIQLAFQNHQKGIKAQVGHGEQEFFFVRVGREMQRIDWSSIYGLRAIKNYVEVLCKDRPVAIPVRGTLKVFLETKLPSTYKNAFLRINRSELLHKDVIQGVNGKNVSTPYGIFSTTRGNLLRRALPN